VKRCPAYFLRQARGASLEETMKRKTGMNSAKTRAVPAAMAGTGEKW
jgi:hypothetical protein